MKNVERAVTMLNELMNETLSTWDNLPIHRNDLAFGWGFCDEEKGTYSVRPFWSTSLHKVKEICDILEVNECTYYAKVEINAMGELAPSIYFF